MSHADLSPAASARSTCPAERWVDRIGIVLTLILPVMLVVSRGAGETFVAVLGVLFLMRSAMTRQWNWLNSWTVRLSLIWWAWVLFCSLISPYSHKAQALVLIRWPIFVAALEFWLLREGFVRKWAVRLTQIGAIYIMAQEALQFATGHNLFGDPRRPSGELTGPYDEPRAGPIMSRIIFPAAVPPVYALLGKGFFGIIGGILLLCVCMASIVLFGQRMPTVLTAFGLLVGGLILPRLRWPSLLALIAGAGLIVASAWISPPTFNRLVVKFAHQMATWPSSDYGELAARGASIVQSHPLVGQGFDSFQKTCLNAKYWHGWPQILEGARGFHYVPQPPMSDLPAVWRWLHALGDGARICAQHPHNHYLQALVESGVPGLILFCAMIVGWGRALLSRRFGNLTALRTGLFLTFLVQEWPIASTSDFVNMPLGGWFFFLLGLGLAEARYGRDISAQTSETTP